MKKIISLLIIGAIIISTFGPGLTIAETLEGTPEPTVTPEPTPTPTPSFAEATEGEPEPSPSPSPTPEPSVTPTPTPEPTPTPTPEPSPSPSPSPSPEPSPSPSPTPTPTPSFAEATEGEPEPSPSPSSSPEPEQGDIVTKFFQNISGNMLTAVSAPVVKAIWEMQGPLASLLGTDDYSDTGAQFLPSGQYQVSKNIGICAVVSDSQGVSDIDSVSGKISYPMINISIDPESAKKACGQEVGTQLLMTQLAKEDGLNLFCNTIQNNNNNLPAFYDFYTFNELCGTDGELAKETAYVYCADGNLAYDDPSGDYKVEIFAKDKTNTVGNVLENYFDYLELTAYEVDFNTINYGNVNLNSEKTIDGDLIWNDPKGENQATVRNVGNTRLQMSVVQNDMGLGKTDDIWNIRYSAKVGTNDVWKNYWPEEVTLLDDPLDLSGTAEMNFSIKVLNFPETMGPEYAGKMTLTAGRVEHLACQLVSAE